MNNEKASLDRWINQHLALQEERMRSSTPNGASPFAWHKPSTNDLLPSTSLNITPKVDVDQPLEYIK